MLRIKIINVIYSKNLFFNVGSDIFKVKVGGDLWERIK